MYFQESVYSSPLQNVQRLAIRLYAAGSVPWRRIVDQTKRYVSRIDKFLKNFDEGWLMTKGPIIPLEGTRVDKGFNKPVKSRGSVNQASQGVQ